MLSFKEYVIEEITPHTDESPIKGMSRNAYDFLCHLSGPSDHESHYMKEDFVIERKGNGEDEMKPDFSATHGLDPDKFKKTIRYIDQAKKELPEDTNVAKRIHHGLRSTFSSMSSETPKESSAKLAESKRVLKEFAHSRGMKHPFPMLGGNGKTQKSLKEDVLTLGYSGAPHYSAGLPQHNACPRSSTECRDNCLAHEAGNNKIQADHALSSKVIRSHFLALHPEHAGRLIDHEIKNHVKNSKKRGLKPGVRMNITTDYAWEHHAPELFARHPDAQFYDYTKMSNRVGHPNLPENYHLTLSHTGTGHEESNDQHVIKALERGHGVAMVHQIGKNVPTPTHVEDVRSGKRYPIVNGDKDDNTFDRHAIAGLTEGKPGHGVVSGLGLKGSSNKKAGHFANKVDPDGIIRINHPK